MILRSYTLIFSILLLFTGAWSQVQVRQKQQLDEWFLAANQAYANRDFSEAARLYRASIKNGEQVVFSWFNLGNTLVQLNRNDLAMVAYRRTVELAPHFGRAWVQIGDLLFLSGSLAEAVAPYRRALELEVLDEVHVRHALAEIAIALGEWTEAQFHLERTLTLEPDRVDLWFALTATHEGLKDWRAAESTLLQALERAPSAGAEVWFQMAILREKQGDRLGLRRALEEGLLLDPYQTPFRRWLAQLWVEEGSPWMAIFVLEEGLFRGENDDLREDLANLFFEQKRYDEALLHYQALAQKGHSIGRIGIENISNTYWNLGDTARARSVMLRK